MTTSYFANDAQLEEAALALLGLIRAFPDNLLNDLDRDQLAEAADHMFNLDAHLEG